MRDFCLSCFADVGEDEKAVSLDSCSTNVCSKCWQEMRPFERILLWILMRPADDGGLGLGPFLEELPDITKKAFTHFTGHSLYDRCRECGKAT